MTLALNLHISKENFLSLDSVSIFLKDQFTTTTGNNNFGEEDMNNPSNYDEDASSSSSSSSSEGHTLAGLNCDRYGGPSSHIAQEMVYWEDIPTDTQYVSPFKRKNGNGPVQYLTFEPDQGGW